MVALVLVLPLLANVGGEEEGDEGKQGEDILKLLQIQFIHFPRRWKGGGKHLPHTRDRKPPGQHHILGKCQGEEDRDGGGGGDGDGDGDGDCDGDVLLKR